jgi:hypothetical protein
VTKARTPVRWATDIPVVLNTVYGPDHFPISVTNVARDLSRHWFPEDPITLIKGDNLPGFDGALVRAPAGETGWGIIYNNAIASKGRINFTLAHEFGHYLAHRLAHPDGIYCGQQDVVRWDSAYGKLEHEANEFASHLLMPLDDYRGQIDARDAVTFDMLAHCAERYEVSLVAATLRWLQYTEKRAVLVVSRDGFMLWARSSSSALRTGAFFRTSNRVVPVPAASLAAGPPTASIARGGVDLPARVWFEETCREMTIFSESYDFTISLLQLAGDGRRRNAFHDQDEDDAEDVSSVIRRKHGL